MKKKIEHTENFRLFEQYGLDLESTGMTLLHDETFHFLYIKVVSKATKRDINTSITNN
jgi:hypothetical protein